MTAKPHWVCPRCHIGIPYAFAICVACMSFGNGSARFTAGGEIRRAEADQHGKPIEEPAS